MIQIDTADQQKIIFKILKEPLEFTEKSKAKLGITIDEFSCKVTEVKINSPASKSEFQIGDKILAINGEKVYCNFDSNFNINDKVASLEGNIIFFLILRDGKEIGISMKR